MADRQPEERGDWKERKKESNYFNRSKGGGKSKESVSNKEWTGKHGDSGWVFIEPWKCCETLEKGNGRRICIRYEGEKKGKEYFKKKGVGVRSPAAYLHRDTESSEESPALTGEEGRIRGRFK